MERADRNIRHLAVELSVVIPAHNESDRLARGRDRIASVLENLGHQRCEVIVVDDGSTDDSGVRAAELYSEISNCQVVRQERNLGKGAAVRLGIMSSSGAKVIVCDADMAIDPTQIPDMMVALDRSVIVFGSRADTGPIRYDSWLRTRSGATFNAIVRHYVKTSLRDTQCGFKGFTLGVARTLANLALIDGFAYDVEVLHLARRLKIPVGSMHVTWDDVAGSSVRLIHDSRVMLRDIRSLKRLDHAGLSVDLPRDIAVATVRESARAARVNGVALARGVNHTLAIVPRSAAVGAIGLATALGGQLRTFQPEELRDHELLAV